MALIAKAPEIFKLGSRLYKTVSPRVANLLRGKGFVKLTARQATAQAGKAKKITEQLAKKLDSKGIPQVPTAASKTASTVKKIPVKRVKTYKDWKQTTDKINKRNPKTKRPPVEKKVVSKTKKTKEQINKETQATRNAESRKQARNKQGQNTKSTKKKVETGSTVIPRSTSKIIKQPSRLASIKKFGKKWGPGIIGGTIGGLTGVAALNQLNKKKLPQTTGGSGGTQSQSLSGEAEIAANMVGKPPKPSVTAAEQQAADSFPQGTGETLPSYFNNPIFKKEIKERGGWKKFAPTTMSGKMSRFGRIGDVKTENLMAETVYRELDQNKNRTDAEDKLHTELYGVVVKKKGGKVKKKKKTKQGYKSRKDESIAMRVKKKRTKKQLKSSRNESYGKWGKGKGKGKVNKVFRRGGGKALRGFGKATYSNKPY